MILIILPNTAKLQHCFAIPVNKTINFVNKVDNMIRVNKFNVDEVREVCSKKVAPLLDYDIAESNFLVFCIDRLVFAKDGYSDTLDTDTRQKLDDFIVCCYWMDEDEFCSQLSEVVSSKDLVRAIETGNQEFEVNTLFNLMRVRHEEGTFV